MTSDCGPCYKDSLSAEVSLVYLEMLLWVVIKQLVGTRVVRSWGETLQINLGGTSTLASTSVCYCMISAGDIHDAGSAN